MKAAALCALLALGLAATAHAKMNRDDALRSRAVQFQHVLQPLEPSAEIVTTSTPAPPTTPAVVPPPPVVEIIEMLGWQYTNSAYIYALLAVTILSGPLYFYFTFVGNAKQIRDPFAALTGALFAFYLLLGLLINLRVPPIIGISAASTVFGAYFMLGFHFPEEFGWTSTILAADVILVALVYNLTAPLVWPNYGLLGLIPGFLAAPPAVQLLSYFTTLLFVACLIYLAQIYVGPERKCPPVVNRNLVSSFVAAFIVTAAVAYIAAISGAMVTTPLEPVGYFDMPSLFHYYESPTYLLLVLWAGLTMAGYRVQQRRDQKKGLFE